MARMYRLWPEELPHKRKCGRRHAKVAVEKVLQQRTETYGSQDTQKVGNQNAAFGELGQ